MVRLHGLHDFDGSCDEAERALALGERAGATNVIANARYVRGMARGVTARLEECVEDLHSAVRLAEEGGHPRVAAQALAFLSFNKNWQGELELADRLGARALAAAREHRLILTLLSGLWMHAIPLIGLGRYDEARQSLEEQLDLAERVGDIIWRNRVVNTMGWLYMECGNLDRAREFNERGALLGKQQGFFECEANAQLNLADTAIIQGDLTEAGERLDFVYRGATNPKTSEWMKWRYSMHLFASMGEHALAKGDVSRASGFANECLGIAEPTSARKYLARGRRLAGDIALTKGHQEDALEAHRKATVKPRAWAIPPSCGELGSLARKCSIVWAIVTRRDVSAGRPRRCWRAAPPRFKTQTSELATKARTSSRNCVSAPLRSARSAALYRPDLARLSPNRG